MVLTAGLQRFSHTHTHKQKALSEFWCLKNNPVVIL